MKTLRVICFVFSFIAFIDILVPLIPWVPFDVETPLVLGKLWLGYPIAYALHVVGITSSYIWRATYIVFGVILWIVYWAVGKLKNKQEKI